MRVTIACPICIKVQWLVPLVYFKIRKKGKLQCPNCAKTYDLNTRTMEIVEVE